MLAKVRARLSLLLVFSMVVTTLGLGGASTVQAEESENAPFETELIVRTVNQFKNAADVQAFVDMADQYNVTVISMNVKQDEDDEVPSGQVFYESSIAPIAAGYESFDALQHVIDAAHSKGIKVHAWIPQFHDQAAFTAHPDWQMHAWVDGTQVPFTGSNGSEYFINPIHHEVQAYERSIINEVIENYDVDGVVLDWIRFDDYNMDVSDYTIGKFEAEFGYSPLTIHFDEASAQRDEWNEWRTEQIGNYVGDIRNDITSSTKPNMKLGVYILPPEFVEVGQDAEKFKAHIDFIAPMAYFDDWGFAADWVYSDEYGILKDTADRVSGEEVDIVATLDNDWSDDEYQQVYKGIRENYPNVQRLSFFAYHTWPEAELAKINERRQWPEAGWEPPVEQDYEAELPDGWKARNIGLKPGTANYDETLEQFEISSLSSDIWGNMDTQNYIYRQIEGDAEIIAKVGTMEQMSEWAKAGVMIRESLDREAKHADMMITPENGATFQYREHTRGSMADQTADAEVPLWVKLSREGDNFTGFISEDGADWHTIGSITIPMSEQAYIGLAVSNPGSSLDNKATFQEVQVLEEGEEPGAGGPNMPPPWQAANIGVEANQGSNSSYDGTSKAFTLKSIETDIWGESDSLHYIYQSLEGDGSISARVHSMVQVSEWAKAGVMFRESLAENAKHADMMMTPNVATFQYRNLTGGSTADATRDANLPKWVKIVRSGDLFIGFISDNGTEWTKVSEREIEMADKVLAGLALSNPGSSDGNQTIIDRVEVHEGSDTEKPSVPGLPQIEEVTGDTIVLTWSASSDNIVIKGYEVTYGQTTVFIPGTRAVLEGLAPDTAYHFEIRAVDLAGNRSDKAEISGRTEGYNVLKGHNWNLFSGAVASGNQVIIQGMGRGIVPLGNHPSQPAVANPPINLKGPRLSVDGDFSVDFSLLASQQARASVQLYGALPVIQDEWREEGRYVSMELSNGKLNVSVYDGDSSYPATGQFNYAGAGEVVVSMARNNGKLEFHLNKNKVVELDDPGVFESGKAYFGADAAVGKSFIMQAIYVKPLNESSSVEIIDQQFKKSGSNAQSLRSLAEKNYPHLSIGTAVSVNALISDPQYAEVLGREFNMITPENDMKFQFIHPQRNQYAFAEMDALMEFAELNNMKVHGHTMAWSEAVPRWVTEGNFSDSELKTILEEHIATVVGRYPQILSWDIINEPLAGMNDDPSIRPSIWYDKLGEEYIEIALRAAHAANPAAKLYMNEYWIEENNVKSNAVYELVKGLKQRGVPIHGVGFQMHEDLTDEWDPVSAEEFKTTASKFAHLGIEVRVSELDMNIHNAVNEETLQEQGEYFGSIADMVKKFNVGGVKFGALSMWGFTDRYSSLQPHHSYGDYGNGLIFDENYGAKPAYDALVESLKEPAPPVHPNPNSGGSANIDDSVANERSAERSFSSNEGGELKLGDRFEAVISEYAQLSDWILKLREMPEAEAKGLLANWKGGSLSPVFELAHLAEKPFVKPTAIKIKADVKRLKEGQTAAIYFYNQTSGQWEKAADSQLVDGYVTAHTEQWGYFAVLAENSAAPTVEFTDILNHWAKQEIELAVRKGFVKGYEDGSFQPDRKVSRAEFIHMLVQALNGAAKTNAAVGAVEVAGTKEAVGIHNASEGSGNSVVFADQASIGKWAQASIAIAVKQGWITGYRDGNLRPNDPLTRIELAAIVARALKLPGAQSQMEFADDAQIPGWAKEYAAALQKAEVMTGKTNKRFAPLDAATRAEAVTVILSII
ncbi:endo-1,4-beta-xylanase [Paenibacillus sp. NPDC057967]|uniref:endo-1,4-beta-xylanase n=1 Tax=Paenibacillus sp. NPDC057967 TaxID=3346293 RepID=UPI0036DA2FEF